MVLIDPSLAGASGDKILSALTELSGKVEELTRELNSCLESIGNGGTKVRFESVESYGIKGTKLRIYGDARLEGSPTDAIEAASDSIELSRWGKERAMATMERLLRTEGAIHGSEHLHEIGNVDTVIDIVGTFKAIEIAGLNRAEFLTAPVAVGCGVTKSAHGSLPVPAPATLSIIQEAGLPICGLETPHELTTPTGAALLSTLAGGRVLTKALRITKRERWLGIGVGNADLSFPNITRVLLGESSESGSEEVVYVLESNVDDVEGEVLGWIFERLKGIAEDVCIVPMVAKKNRPGHIIRVVVTQGLLNKAVETIFDETGTLGVKIFSCQRRKVDRVEEEVEVRINGKLYRVRVKKNLKTGSAKPSYEDCRKIAIEEGLPLRTVFELVGRGQGAHRSASASER
ncbi:MAG: nickel pincer cofactor biosynthesis protein LarC [Candidatus Verstraetearchaeota archaeon]|nr:nickel pincer cofactor biosynthesis protein LarC [Candidatus Verstraetearchaeota archaeon]